MFSFSSGSAGVGIDPEKERAPPPLPTPVIFPTIPIPDAKSLDDFAQKVPNLYKRYCAIQKPTDIKLEDLAALNLHVESDVSIEKLFPEEEDAKHFLPPPNWLNPNEPFRHGSGGLDLFSGSKHAILSNGQKAPDRDQFLAFAKELMCESDDAFRAIVRRKPRPGRTAPKLQIFRRFWAHLDQISHYWDTSLDNYMTYDRPITAGSQNGRPTAQQQPQPPQSTSSTPIKGLKRLSLSGSSTPAKSVPPPPPQETRTRGYTGRRASTGSRMPDTYRIDVVRSLVEPIVTAFGCQTVNPRKVPHLEIKALQIPVTQSGIVWRNPQDRALVKKAFVEGPLLGIQCRAETSFADDQSAATLDLARELSGLLLLAQLRAREGKSKPVIGKGKWWLETPRWGGGPGGEFGEAEGNKDLPQPAASKQKAGNTVTHVSLGRKKSEEEVWKELKPASGEWDPRAIYLSVGKDRSVMHDNVYMVSSIFHHVSILHLEVHPMYTEFVLNGKIPPLDHPDPSWCSPTVQRTRWYDLFEPKDRGELLRALWGILAYDMRPGVPNQPQMQRHSDGQHSFSFRRKASSSSQGSSKLAPSTRAHSVAF